MKIFTEQNLIILIVMCIIGISILICMFIAHASLIKNIKSLNAKNLFLSNTNSYVVNYPDTRERVYQSCKPITLHIDPYSFKEKDVNKNGLNLKTYVPKFKKFTFKRFVRVVLSILFALSVLIVILCSILMLGDFFHQDIVEILHMEYTRTFWEYFKSYDLLFGSFILSMICFTGIRMIGDTIKNYQKLEQTYITVYNRAEYEKTFAPVLVNLD